MRALVRADVLGTLACVSAEQGLNESIGRRRRGRQWITLKSFPPERSKTSSFPRSGEGNLSPGSQVFSKSDHQQSLREDKGLPDTTVVFSDLSWRDSSPGRFSGCPKHNSGLFASAHRGCEAASGLRATNERGKLLFPPSECVCSFLVQTGGQRAKRR